MISNELDVEALRMRLRTRSRIQVRNFLQESAAETLRKCLEQEVPWSIAQRSDLAESARAHESLDDERLLQMAQQRAANGYEFFFDRYRMIEARRDGTEPGLILHTVVDFLNSPPFLDFARFLTGEPRIRMVSAIAARYRQGHFLNLHNDSAADEDREFAYVINLSRGWRPDWGGLLHFVCNDLGVTEVFMPRWNSLSLFRVPQLHFVSPVCPWAGDHRYTITGWFRRN